MDRTNHEAAAIYLERYALLDIERREREGELRFRSEAARALKSGRRPLDRVLAGIGDLLIWLGQKLKKGARQESPAIV